MKNLNKLGLVFGIGSLVALCATGCSDDGSTGGTAGTAGTTAGANTGGTTAGATTGGAGAATGGAGASTGGAGASTGGAGAGGAGGAVGGAGGAGGLGGAGGAGGAGGGMGGMGMGGAASADCMKWCVGNTGLPKVCMGSNLLNPLVDNEGKCLAECAKPANAAGLSCWNMHLGFIKMPSDQDPHCGHASGMPGKAGTCAEIK